MNEGIRSRLRRAVDALCDFEVHTKLWIDGIRTDPEEDSFEDVVLFLVDELATPTADEMLDHILADKEELAAFLSLTSSLESLIPHLDEKMSFQSALRDGVRWRACRDASCKLRALLG
jgi:hypothetical protein